MTTSSATEPAPVSAGNLMRNALRVRDFRLLWIGQGLSVLGDQFTMIALPWLVLQITGDPLALGLVMALSGIPRALFILLGGAIVDRLSPRVVMLGSDAVRLILMALLAALALTGQTQLWMLYVIALISGTVSGFFIPASSSIMPSLIPKEDLQGANSLSMGTMSACGLLGPSLAGALIALFGDPRSQTGIGAAFAVDALSFLASLITLWLIRARPAAPQGAHDNVLRSIADGMRYVWSDASMRVMLIILAIVPFMSAGPMVVGVPVLANTRLIEGAMAFGFIMSGYGAGSIAGYALAGSVKLRRMGIFIPVIIILFGIGAIVMGITTWTPLTVIDQIIMGAANGYFAIVFITWLQSHTPLDKLGRVMSLTMFFNLGLSPFSQALAGAISAISLDALFFGSGALLILFGLLTSANRSVREMTL